MGYIVDISETLSMEVLVLISSLEVSEHLLLI